MKKILMAGVAVGALSFGIVEGASATTDIPAFTPGWNLVGLMKTAEQPAMDVTELGDVTSVWKWTTINGIKTWAVYLPGEANPGDYAATKGFGQLNTIEPGEGFWVNVPDTTTTTTTVTTTTTTVAPATTTSTSTPTTTTTTTTLPSSSLLNTAWFVGGSPTPTAPRDANILLFLDATHYVHAKSTDGSADPDCTINGIDYGTYTWNPVNNLFSTTSIYTTPSFSCGAGGMTQATFVANGNTAILTNPGDSAVGGIQKIISTNNPLVGAWGGIDSTTQEGAVLVFLDDSNFMFIEKKKTPASPDPDSCGQTGMEHGTYTWDPNTKLFTANVPVDTNGCWGISSLPSGTTVEVSGGTLQIAVPGESGITTLPKLN